jgi:hypothetical protein
VLRRPVESTLYSQVQETRLDVPFERECGYHWLAVHEHTVEELDGQALWERCLLPVGSSAAAS